MVDMPEDHSNCERCAPAAPKLQWTQVNKKFIPVEDHVQAGEYERSLKRRPSPFVTQLKLDENDTGTVRVGINIPSLLHRALSRLPSGNRTERPSLSWRLNTNFTPVASLNLPKFVILSNKPDKEHAQPPSFKIPLRKEQLRSLEWMLQQESPDANRSSKRKFRKLFWIHWDGGLRVAPRDQSTSGEEFWQIKLVTERRPSLSALLIARSKT